MSRRGFAPNTSTGEDWETKNAEAWARRRAAEAAQNGGGFITRADLSQTVNSIAEGRADAVGEEHDKMCRDINKALKEIRTELAELRTELRIVKERSAMEQRLAALESK